MNDDPTDNRNPIGCLDQPPSPEAVRARLGISAAVCLFVGGGLWMSGQYPGIHGPLVRVGVMAAAAWLAFPTLSRVRWRPKTLTQQVVVIGLAVLIVVRPRIFLPLALVLGIVALFKVPSQRSRDRH